MSSEVDIAVLQTKMAAFEAMVIQHQEQSHKDRVAMTEKLESLETKIQGVVDTWNSATMLGRFLGLLATIATIVSGFWVFAGNAPK